MLMVAVLVILMVNYTHQVLTYICTPNGLRIL